MTPDNKALERTYFIGGPPRVGKTTLAYKLAKMVHGHVVMTDAVRNSAKKVCEDKSGPLFMINHYNKFSDEKWLDRYINKPELVVEAQVNESKAIWRSVVSFCNMFCEDNANHIVEGIAVLPELVASMENQPKHVVFVGNTDEYHVETILKYGKDNPEQCWMAYLGYSEDRIRAFANYVKCMSQYFREESAKYGFAYVELSDGDFKNSLQEAINIAQR